nr:hypothetical protein [Stackebrandtia endophytica]
MPGFLDVAPIGVPVQSGKRGKYLVVEVPPTQLTNERLRCTVVPGHLPGRHTTEVEEGTEPTGPVPRQVVVPVGVVAAVGHPVLPTAQPLGLTAGDLADRLGLDPAQYGPGVDTGEAVRNPDTFGRRFDVAPTDSRPGSPVRCEHSIVVAAGGGTHLARRDDGDAVEDLQVDPVVPARPAESFLTGDRVSTVVSRHGRRRRAVLVTQSKHLVDDVALAYREVSTEPSYRRSQVEQAVQQESPSVGRHGQVRIDHEHRHHSVEVPTGGGQRRVVVDA